MMPEIKILSSPRWKDYELLDSGNGQKLERFGAHTFIRPEVQAMWSRGLPAARWQEADAEFVPSGEESGGHWRVRTALPESWVLTYPLNGGLKFSVGTTPGRHLGVFPECASHWDWMSEKIELAQKTGEQAAHVLNLFGYTGLASLACAQAGAKVTHVDASKKSVSWARDNAALSGLAERPIRWIVEDALKYVEREARRGVKYDGIVLDPPKFGRGPKGEVWEVFKSLPELLIACRSVLSATPLFVVLTVYAVKLPALHAHSVLAEMMDKFDGKLECGELVTLDGSGGRPLSQAVFARWSVP